MKIPNKRKLSQLVKFDEEIAKCETIASRLRFRKRNNKVLCKGILKEKGKREFLNEDEDLNLKVKYNKVWYPHAQYDIVMARSGTKLLKEAKGTLKRSHRGGICLL